MKTKIIASLLAASLMSSLTSAGELPLKTGYLPASEFVKITKQASDRIQAVKPDKQPLSEADRQLLLDWTSSGLMQIHLSQIVLKKTASAEIKVLATGEVDEQTAVLNKLKEIAAANGIQLPDRPDAAALQMGEALQTKAGAEMDREYLMQSGIRNHEAQKDALTRASSSESKALAEIAHFAIPYTDFQKGLAKETASKDLAAGDP